MSRTHLPPLRILLVTRAYTTHRIGGLERHARDIAEGFSSRGHDVTVWTTSRDEGAEEECRNGVLVRYFPNTAPGLHSREFQAAVLQELSKPHDYSILLVESRSAEWALERLKPPQRPRAIMFIHGSEVSEELSIVAFDRGPGRWFRLFSQRVPAMLRSLAKARAHFSAERVVCVSEYMADHLAAVYLAPPEKLRVVRNGIPLRPLPTRKERQLARSRRGLPSDAVLLLCIGRLAPDKGFDTALRAFARVGHEVVCAMIVVGDGPDRARLTGLAGQLGIAERVRFVGAIPQEDTPDYYAAADILLLPGVRYEGHPYVLVEGAAAGNAVIASNRAGLGSELTGGDMALTVRPGNIDDVADAMSALLRSSELRTKLGSRLRSYAERHYSLDAMLDGVEAVVAELI